MINCKNGNNMDCVFICAYLIVDFCYYVHKSVVVQFCRVLTLVCCIYHDSFGLRPSSGLAERVDTLLTSKFWRHRRATGCFSRLLTGKMHNDKNVTNCLL